MSRSFLRYAVTWFPIVALSSLIGCGSAGPDAAARKESAAMAPATEPNIKQAGDGGAKPAGDEKTADTVGPAAASLKPMIIYTAHLDVVVKELDAATPEVNKLLEAHKGRIIRSDARSDTGSRRTANYSLAVPVENFRKLVEELVGLGHPERNSIESQDVTEEYLDVQIRLKNLREKHESLLKLRKEKANSLDDVLKIDPHISTVQTDIDRVEGRLKYLSAKSAFSTVNLTLREIKDYKPPSSPNFRDRVSRTFDSSLEGLVNFGEAIALTAVALTPWLPILIPLGVLGFYLIRKGWRAHRLRKLVNQVVIADDEPEQAPSAG